MNNIYQENFFHPVSGLLLSVIYSPDSLQPVYPVFLFEGDQVLASGEEEVGTVEELLADGWTFPTTIEEFGVYVVDRDAWLAESQSDEPVVDLPEEEPVGEDDVESEETPDGEEVLVTITRFSVEDNGNHTLILDYQNPDSPVVHSLTGVNDEPLPLPGDKNELIDQGFYFPLDEQQFLVYMEDPAQWALTYLPDITGEDIQVVEDDDVEGSDPAIIPGEEQPDTEIPGVEEEDEPIAINNQGYSLDMEFSGVDGSDFNISASIDLSGEIFPDSPGIPVSEESLMPIASFTYLNKPGFRTSGSFFEYVSRSVPVNWSVSTPDGSYVSTDFRPGNLSVSYREALRGEDQGIHDLSFSLPDEVGLMNTANNELSMQWLVQPYGYSIGTNSSILPFSAGQDINVLDGESVDIVLYARLIGGTSIDSVDSDTGVDGDFRTSDNTPTFSGTASPGSTVRLTTDGTLYGETQTDSNGDWSFAHQNPTELPDGQLLLTAEDLNTGGLGYQDVTIDTEFNITLDTNLQNPSNSNFSLSSQDRQTLEEKIRNAADFWENIIKNDITDIDDNGTYGFVDDVEIEFLIGQPGGSLAFATDFKFRSDLTGTSAVNTSSSDKHIPYHAKIFIPENQVQAIIDDPTGQGFTTLLHEMGHAIGLNSGTYAKLGLIKSVGRFTENGKTYERYGFTGSNALDAYHDLGGLETHSSVPLDHIQVDPTTGQSIGSPSNPVHWNEWLFPDGAGEKYTDISLPEGVLSDDALMTTANPAGKNAYLSQISFGALEDIGYEVDQTLKANALTVTVHRGSFFTGQVADLLGVDFLQNPLFDMPY